MTSTKTRFRGDSIGDVERQMRARYGLIPEYELMHLDMTSWDSFIDPEFTMKAVVVDEELEESLRLHFDEMVREPWTSWPSVFPWRLTPSIDEADLGMLP